MSGRTTLFVSNLPLTARAKELAKDFEKCVPGLVHWEDPAGSQTGHNEHRYGRLVRCDIPAPKVEGNKP